MTWNTIRVATTGEVNVLEAKAVAFAERHDADLPGIGYDGVSDLEGAIAPDRSDDQVQAQTKSYLRKLWRRAVSRTLGSGAEGIVGGYVGYHTA